MAPTATWSYFAQRLRPARDYWLATTTADGAAHVAPIWGVMLDQNFHFYSERTTVKARNIERDPRVALHLESATEVLIVHGRAEDLGAPTSRPDLLDALALKYTRPADLRYLPTTDPAFDVCWIVRADTAMSWDLRDYERSQRRWRAAQSPRDTCDPESR